MNTGVRRWPDAQDLLDARVKAVATAAIGCAGTGRHGILSRLARARGSLNVP
jgi:hypothetical protein